ncbi:S1 family peptidase [Virgibacillus flavescens]|uniref:S1 family peptidase n=1 Tax=Virgibacillus flavescens TaxID=1611422 RepID=UPI003D33C154
MDKEDKRTHDVIDDDLYEEIDDDELVELVDIERKKAWKRAQENKEQQKPKRPFPKWAFWLIAAMMMLNVFAFYPKVISIPAIEFLATSSKLSMQKDIRTYKDSVVVIESSESSGTGFSVHGDGTILTNFHVIEGEDNVTVVFPEEGLKNAEVVATYPTIDLAVLKAEGGNYPSLELAEDPTVNKGDAIYFIGNPLRFHGIANKGTIIKETTLSGWEKPVMMIDAPVYNGNSGSPVINQDGKVIGVVFATLDSEDLGKVGLYIPIEYYYSFHE